MTQGEELKTRSWEMLPDENIQAYQAFAAYLDLPEDRRRYSVIADAVGSSLKTVRSWAETYNWSERLQSWTAHVGQLAARERAETLSEMQKNELSIACKTLLLVDQELDKLLKLSATDPEPVVKPLTLCKLAESSIKLSRLLHDKPSEIVSGEVRIDIREERRFLQSVAKHPELVDAVIQEYDARNIPR